MHEKHFIGFRSEELELRMKPEPVEVRAQKPEIKCVNKIYFL
jgi:hypothetical protein